MDSVALVQDALAPLQRIRYTIQRGNHIKMNLRRRYDDYCSMIEHLESKPEVIAANEIEREFRRLIELFTRFADLLTEYTAAPGDSKARKFSIKTKWAADWENVKTELDEIHADVMYQLELIRLKGAFRSSTTEVLQVFHILHVESASPAGCGCRC